MKDLDIFKESKAADQMYMICNRCGHGLKVADMRKHKPVELGHEEIMCVFIEPCDCEGEK